MKRKEFLQSVVDVKEIRQVEKLGLDDEQLTSLISRVTIDLDRVHHWAENWTSWEGERVEATEVHTFEGDFLIMYKYDDFTKLMNQ